MVKTSRRAGPSPYPRLVFHAVRTGDFVSSLVVASILSYFVYHLRRDQFRIPWTFLVLFGASLLSLLMLSVTFALHLCHVLSPLMNLIVNVLLTILWIVGMGMLGWNMIGTLPHRCNADNWGSETGIMVCHIYKTAFAFTVLAIVFFLAMIVLDVRARKQQTRLGKYDHMRDESFDLKPTQQPFSPSALGRHHEAPVEPWQSGGQEPIDYHSRGLSRSTVQSNGNGYVSPSEQTHYDGGHESLRQR